MNSLKRFPEITRFVEVKKKEKRKNDTEENHPGYVDDSWPLES